MSPSSFYITLFILPFFFGGEARVNQIASQTVCVFNEIVVIGSDYAFHLKLLRLAQHICVSVEIVAIGSDNVHFS